jgi:hypothetical protein
MPVPAHHPSCDHPPSQAHCQGPTPHQPMHYCLQASPWQLRQLTPPPPPAKAQHVHPLGERTLASRLMLPSESVPSPPRMLRTRLRMGPEATAGGAGRRQGAGVHRRHQGLQCRQVAGAGRPGWGCRRRCRAATCPHVSGAAVTHCCRAATCPHVSGAAATHLCQASASPARRCGRPWRPTIVPRPPSPQTPGSGARSSTC